MAAINPCRLIYDQDIAEVAAAEEGGRAVVRVALLGKLEEDDRVTWIQYSGDARVRDVVTCLLQAFHPPTAGHRLELMVYYQNESSKTLESPEHTLTAELEEGALGISAKFHKKSWCIIQ